MLRSPQRHATAAASEDAPPRDTSRRGPLRADAPFGFDAPVADEVEIRAQSRVIRRFQPGASIHETVSARVSTVDRDEEKSEQRLVGRLTRYSEARRRYLELPNRLLTVEAFERQRLAVHGSMYIHLQRVELAHHEVGTMLKGR